MSKGISTATCTDKLELCICRHSGKMRWEHKKVTIIKFSPFLSFPSLTSTIAPLPLPTPYTPTNHTTSLPLSSPLSLSLSLHPSTSLTPLSTPLTPHLSSSLPSALPLSNLSRSSLLLPSPPSPLLCDLHLLHGGLSCLVQSCLPFPWSYGARKGEDNVASLHG